MQETIPQEKQESDDWRTEVSSEQRDIVKLQDGESAVFKFGNEGTKKTHPDYGNSIMFVVEHKGDEKLFFVNANNFALLLQIKALGELKGLKAKISRTGSKKSDTRYKIEKADTETDPEQEVQEEDKKL